MKLTCVCSEFPLTMLLPDDSHGHPGSFFTAWPFRLDHPRMFYCSPWPSKTRLAVHTDNMDIEFYMGTYCPVVTPYRITLWLHSLGQLNTPNTQNSSESVIELVSHKPEPSRRPYPRPCFRVKATFSIFMWVWEAITRPTVFPYPVDNAVGNGNCKIKHERIVVLFWRILIRPYFGGEGAPT